MKKLHVFIAVMLALASCESFTYNFHGKRARQLHRPSPLVFDRIVDFRIEQMSWPSSRTDFMSKGKRYYEVMQNFPYATLKFDIKDSNNMTFYFSGHTQDLQEMNRSGKVDLNSYNGSAKFYKEDGKFLWKLKMK